MARWSIHNPKRPQPSGVPSTIISDTGFDLHSGIGLFCQKHKGTRWVYDIKHKTACLLKRVFQDNRSLGEFAERAHRFKLQVSLTALGSLAPPQQRSKARYMNADVLTGWATRHLALLNSRQAMRQAGLKPAQVEEKLEWLRKYEPQIKRWGEIMAMVEATEHYVRHEGHHRNAQAELTARMPQSTAHATGPASAVVGVCGGTSGAACRQGTLVGFE